MEWQPIETAPTGGETIWQAIVFAANKPGGKRRVCYAWWRDNGGWCDGDSGDWDDPLYDVTHWIPWPEPPAKADRSRMVETPQEAPCEARERRSRRDLP